MKRHTIDLSSSHATGADPPGSAGHGIRTTEQIGNTRHMTPEGFLVCENVPIARTGWMVYGPNEVPVKTGDTGIVMIHRGPETLFHPETIASFVGKAVTDDHPPEGEVTPLNWKQHSRGTVFNVRQGTGEDADTLRADFLVTDQEAIKAIQAGKVEVSAGYEADYETTGSGEGRQLHILGNHVALVERGRCGPRCAIGDRQTPIPTERTPPMATRKTLPRRALAADARQKVLDATMAAAKKALDEALAADPDALAEEEVDGVHVHLHMPGSTAAIDPAIAASNEVGGAADAQAAGEAQAELTAAHPVIKGISDRMDAFKTMMDTLMERLPAKATADADPEPKDEEEDDAKKEKATTGDSAALATGFQQLVADCEVLVPGFKAPTMDAAASRKTTVDSMCATRRKALEVYAATTHGASTLASIGGSDVSGMTCDAAAIVFKAAAYAQKLVNNAKTTDGAGSVGKVADKPTPRVKTIAEINADNAKAFPRPE